MNEDMWRAIVSLAVKQARDITDDQEALKVQALYKQWEKQFGRQIRRYVCLSVSSQLRGKASV